MAGTRPVDVPDQVQLLGHPQQRADVPDSTRADGPRLTQVRLGRWVSGAQYRLTRN